MEKYILCGELSCSTSKSSLTGTGGVGGSHCRAKLYKGRRRGSVEFFGIWRLDRMMKELVTNGFVGLLFYFLREGFKVKFMHGLDHDNVLRFCEWYETSRHIWIITELTSGGTLAQILEQDGWIPPNKMSGFISDIALGLSYLHSLNILYCDLQPNKIVLDTCSLLKLSDFTLAQSSDHNTNLSKHDFSAAVRNWFLMQQCWPEQPGTLQVKGKQEKQEKLTEEEDEWGSRVSLTPADLIPSPFYAAPELYWGSGVSVLGDLWSLGCVVCEMLTGRHPFSHHGSSEALEAAICCGNDGGSVKLEGWDGVGEDSGKWEVWSEMVSGLLTRSSTQRYSWDEVNHILSSNLDP